MDDQKKGWAILGIKKAAVVSKYAIDLVFLFGLIGLALLCADMFAQAFAELDALIEAGELSEAVKRYTISLFGMVALALLILMRRRRRYDKGFAGQMQEDEEGQ